MAHQSPQLGRVPLLLVLVVTGACGMMPWFAIAASSASSASEFLEVVRTSWLPGCLGLLGATLVGSVLLQVAGRRSLREAQSLLHELGRKLDDASGQNQQMQAEFATAQKQLEATNEELSEARVRAESASVSKSSFLATMSHEIRSPLNGVLGVVDLLFKTPLNPKQQDYAEIIRNSGTSLLVILNEVLDFSKLEVGRLRLEVVQFDPREVIEEAVELFAGRAQLKRIELCCEIDPALPREVRGDPVRLRQILTNLFENAVKFTENGGVSLRVEVTRRDQRHISLALHVIDTGIGISPSALGRLFVPFSQADASTTRKYGGTGLGLAISKRLVQMMGGEIRVRSKPGRGTEFVVNLPFEAEAREPTRLLKGVRVLVAAGGSLQRDCLQRQLTRLGARADVCSSGHEAVQRLRANMHGEGRYSVAILDAHLDDIDGFQIARTIHGDPVLHCDRVVVLASFGDVNAEEASTQDGIDAVISKPVRPSQLTQLLDLSTPINDPHATESAQLPEIVSGYALLVEDNYVNRLMALEMLSLLGWSADSVENGYEAVEAVERGDYDVVFMDCQMPGMDGYQATQTIRRLEEPRGKHTRIIAVTANALDTDRQKCLDAGMDDYLSKPFTIHQLTSIMKAGPLPQTATLRPPTPRTAPPRPGAAALVEKVAGSAPAQEAELLDARLEITSKMEGAAQLDRAALHSIWQLEKMGRPGLLERLVTQYLTDSVNLIAELRDSARVADAPTARRAAHTLKSSSAGLGATGLAELCREAEEHARNGSTRDVKTRLPSIEAEYRKVRAALDALLVEESTP